MEQMQRLLFTEKPWQAQFYTEIQIICWDSAGTQQSTFSILYIPMLQKQQRILLVNLFQLFY